MKYKTNKLKNLEKKRFSLLTNDLEHCFICKKTPVDIHEIYGGSNRKRSMIYGFCVPLCRKHHQDLETLKYLKEIMQKEYEKEHTREEFIKIIGKSCL